MDAKQESPEEIDYSYSPVPEEGRSRCDASPTAKTVLVIGALGKATDPTGAPGNRFQLFLHIRQALQNQGLRLESKRLQCHEHVWQNLVRMAYRQRALHQVEIEISNTGHGAELVADQRLFGRAIHLGNGQLGRLLGRRLIHAHSLHADGLQRLLDGRQRRQFVLHGQRLRMSVYRHGNDLDVFTPQGHSRVQRVDPLHQSDDSAAGGRLTALMPGKVVAMLVTEGQQVKQGDALAVTEAMKMEHTLTAPHDGIVSAILCAVGDQLAEGVELLRLEAAA